jgi:hypothetical protein
MQIQSPEMRQHSSQNSDNQSSAFRVLLIVNIEGRRRSVLKYFENVRFDSIIICSTWAVSLDNPFSATWSFSTSQRAGSEMPLLS